MAEPGTAWNAVANRQVGHSVKCSSFASTSKSQNPRACPRPPLVVPVPGHTPATPARSDPVPVTHVKETCRHGACPVERDRINAVAFDTHPKITDVSFVVAETAGPLRFVSTALKRQHQIVG